MLSIRHRNPGSHRAQEQFAFFGKFAGKKVAYLDGSSLFFKVDFL